MRITFITLKIDLVKGGGANRGLDIKLRALQKNGHEIRLITIFPELNHLPEEGVPYPVAEAPSTDRSFRALQNHVVELLKKHESVTDIYDIEGVTCLWAGGMYRLNGGSVPTVAYLPTYMEAMNLLSYEAPDIRLGIKPWLSFHLEVRAVWIKHWLWVKTVGMRYARALDRIYVPSPISQDIYARFGFPKNRIDLLPEFVDMSHFPQPKPSTFPKAFSPERPFRILHVGRLMYMKGVDLLMEAVAGLRRNGKNVILEIVGDGPQRDRLIRQAERLGIRDSVHFLPWVEEAALAPYYDACDIFAHVCRFPEPLGRTILEAMHFAKPIISTEGSGSAWAAGAAGISVPMSRADKIEQSLTSLYDHPEQLATLSNSARERIGYFDLSEWTANFERSLTQLK